MADSPSTVEYLDGQGDTLGPVANFGAQIFVFLTFLTSFHALSTELLPAMTPMALLAGVFGILVLAPRLVLHRIPVSVAVLAMIGWMLLSSLWTGNPEATSNAFIREIPIYVGTILVIGMIPLRSMVPALLWAIRVVVVVTVVAVLVSADARVHIDDTGLNPPLPGWHGLFPHKNVMSPFFVFGVLTILTFDRSLWLKYGTLVLIAGVMAGSDSATGMFSIVLAISIWVWLQLYRNLDIRGSTVFVLSSAAMALLFLVGVITSISSILAASGREVTFTGRTFIWGAVWTAITERPFTGWGLDGILVGPLTPRTAAAWREIGFQPPHSHNGLLDLMVELGLVGTVLFAAVYFSTLVAGIGLIRENTKVGAWVVSVLLVQAFISISEPVFVGLGWFTMAVMMRTVTLRRHGMDFESGPELADRLPVGGFRPRAWR